MFSEEHEGMESLIAALRDPACYPHPAQTVELVETHISWVLLAGACYRLALDGDLALQR